jgi:uncharacterized protein (TIGR00299 family) protein
LRPDPDGNDAGMAELLIDMPSGVAGDMLLAALLACGGDRERLERDLAGLGCGPIAIRADAVTAGSLGALRVAVDAPQEPTWTPQVRLDWNRAAAAAATPAAPTAPITPPAHGHRPWRLIRDLLERAALPEAVRARAQRVFRLLAEAEGAVHGIAPEEVEFHEVGSLDAIADVVGVCLLLDQLGIDRIVAGAITPGHGTVACAHGRMPVPVPAVAEILRRTGAPTRLLHRDTGELTTPTGAALVCALADAWIDRDAPVVGRIRAQGFGAGHKEIPGLVNAVRCLLVDPAETADDDALGELACQIDDQTGEDLAPILARLLAAGARDAWLTPIVMKKGRPAWQLTALCRTADRQRLGELILLHTTTIGVRFHACTRQTLTRQESSVTIDGQRIRIKTVTLPDGTTRRKPEADDVHAAAEALGLTAAQVRQRVLAAG